MLYGKKKEESGLHLLRRVKDTSTLVPGNSYHIRKMISREGNTIKDEVYDIILKEFKDGVLIEQDTDNQYPVGGNEFEIFVREKI